MENITFAPAYVALYPSLAEIARDHGYSLAIHGSVGKSNMSDLDLIAVPWMEDCTTAELLMRNTARYLVTTFNKPIVDAMQGTKPILKPHGRLAYRFPLGNGSAIDISVMPSNV
mgnify:CR=1 FL=1